MLETVLVQQPLKLTISSAQLTTSLKESTTSTTFLLLDSVPSSASSAEGLAPISTSTSPTVTHCSHPDSHEPDLATSMSDAAIKLLPYRALDLKKEGVLNLFQLV